MRPLLPAFLSSLTLRAPARTLARLRQVAGLRECTSAAATSPQLVPVTHAESGEVYRVLRRSSRLLRPVPEREMTRLFRLTEWERHYQQASTAAVRIAGVDEAGRGSLAGPVVAAACVLPEDVWIEGVNDSKLLSAEARDELFAAICGPHSGIAVGVGIVEHDVIDTVNILQATVLAIQKAVRAVPGAAPTRVLVDGLLPRALIAADATTPASPMVGIVQGDRLCMSIAAASVVAKVTRDRLMEELDARYPGYEFAVNKGYPTPRHLELLSALGPSPMHRRTYAPVKRWLEQQHVEGNGASEEM
ncbi:hypothetical protein CDCA_CDCA01G0444 [Cyanidium caldarium]|uniref:Ribonuclease n=1 Tax=Cyanidium caldarium TaxID=2771 RepID=A0AAV9IQ30_CYACA|nr:hypothetical protein CDCA_CDCA01G0444 [Cyanidium caldarium]